jgi:hypothetical protein
MSPTEAPSPQAPEHKGCGGWDLADEDELVAEDERWFLEEREPTSQLHERPRGPYNHRRRR